MKNRFTITESEKERILGLHEQANPLAQGNALTNSTLNTGGGFKTNTTIPKIVSSATPEQKKLIDAANSWVETNKATIPKTVAEISKFLADKVTAKQLTPEALPYVKASLQSNSNGALVFPAEETGGQPAATPASGAAQPINPQVKSAKIEALQTILVNKYKKNIGTSGVNKNGVDGILGAKTIIAVKEVLATKVAKTVTTPGETKNDATVVSATNVAVKNETLAGAPVYYPWIQDGKLNTEKLKQSVEDNSIYKWLDELKKLTPELLTKVRQDFTSSGIPNNLTTTNGTGLRLNVDDVLKTAEKMVANAQPQGGTQSSTKDGSEASGLFPA